MFNSASRITDKKVRGLFARQAQVVSQNLITPQIAQMETMFSETDYFASLGSAPQLTELNKDITPLAGTVPEFSWSVKMKAYQAKLEIPKTMFTYDQIGQVGDMVNQLAQNAMNLPDKLLASLLSGGQTSTDYYYYNSSGDTSYFFGTHTIGSGGGTNLVSGNTPASYFTSSDTYNDTLARKIWNDFNSAYTNMYAWKNTAGEPYYPTIDTKSLTIVCPALMLPAFKFAFGAAYVAQTENMLKGTVLNIVSSPYLPVTGATAADWYLFNTSARVRGVLMFDYAKRSFHQDPEISGANPVPNPSTINVYTTLDSPNDGYVIDTNRHLIKCERYMTLKYGEPSAVICVNNSAT